MVAAPVSAVTDVCLYEGGLTWLDASDFPLIVAHNPPLIAADNPFRDDVYLGGACYHVTWDK
jgi:hypothetical protein